MISGQSLQLKSDRLTNLLAGRIYGQQLTITTPSLSNAGKIVGVNNAQVAINVSGAIQNSGLIGGQSLQLKGDRLDNLLTGRIYGQQLTITTHSLSNAGEIVGVNNAQVAINVSPSLDNAGEIVGVNNAQVAINVSGAIQNSGLIGGQSIQLNGDTLDNLLAGRIYGNQVTMSARSLRNAGEIVGVNAGQTAIHVS